MLGTEVCDEDFYSPIALFVYDRLAHTKKTIHYLQKNEGAENSDLYIFSDAAKDDSRNKSVEEVREYIKTITGFKSVNIIERTSNLGLAQNIYDGVTRLCKERKKIIVLEDDLLTSSSFLFFMNTALRKYNNEKRVWHIAGWNYPISYECEENVYLWRMMNCWGWATWWDRWQHYCKEPDRLMKWDAATKKKFNLDGNYDFFVQVEDNYLKKKDTWAIFWYATIFENDGLCLNPINTMVKNIGHDGTGVNCGNKDIFKSKLNDCFQFKWPEDIKENDKYYRLIINFYRKITPSMIRVIAYKLKRKLFK
ncbi:sugar transferase [Escherichia coli]|nr:sugar transferase [Escherichia coli]